MADSYMGTQDLEILAWMQQFSAGIILTPAVYACSTADAQNLAYVVGEFAAAMAVVTSGGSRTPSAVVEKNQKRATAEQVCRSYAIQIKYNLGISDADKVAIGVRPVNHSRTPSHAPDSSPLLNIIGATPGAQTLRYADSFTPDRAAKPKGVASLQLYVHVAAEAVEDPIAADLRFVGAFTRNPVGVGFNDTEGGKVATYFARWSNLRGAVGPWSLPVSMHIAA